MKAPITSIQIYAGEEHLTTITAHRNNIAQIIHANEINIIQLENNSLGKEIQNYPNIRINLKI